MDVWQYSGSKAVAEYWILGQSVIVVGFFITGTAANHYDRFEVIDGRTGEHISAGLSLVDLPSEEEVAAMVINVGRSLVTG